MGKLKGNLLNLLVLCALIIIVPFFITKGYVMSIMIFVGIYAIVVLGLVLLQGYTGQISLGHAGFFAIGSYASAILSTTFGLPPILTIIVGILLSMAVSVIIGFATLRIKGDYLALATLAFGLLVYRLIVEFSELTGGYGGFRDVPRLSLGSLVVKKDIQYYAVVWFFVVIVFLFVNNITKSPYGLFTKGVQKDEVAVSVLGINVFKLKLKVLLFSAGLTGFAGALYTHYVGFISPDVFVVDRSILFLMMVIVGGSQFSWGGIIGAVFLTFIPEYLKAYQDISIGLYGLVMMLIILYFPGGIASISTMLPGLLGKVKGTKR